ncbi:MAG: DMT family transporter [Methanocorpusculum sp.]|nr:DMT family transporter [Methanocorpusculum sp.]
MKPYHFIFPILVFLGGCSFGPSSSVIKMAYAAGFSSSEVVMSQYFFSLLYLGILAAGLFLFRRRKGGRVVLPKTFGWKNLAGLIFTGVSIALVSTTYMFSLQTVPAYISVILLFQFTWMGVILEAVVTRKLPDRHTVISVVILVAGTLLAAGAGGNVFEVLTVPGVIFGLLSALFYAIYIFLLGRVDVGMHPLNRSFFIIMFALLILVGIFSPAYFTSGVFEAGIWKYGLILGSFGCAVPALLFAIGAPRISTGAASILSSSELPASIICAVLILSEAVSWLQWAGVVLLFFGIAYPYLMQRRKGMDRQINI